MRIAGIIIKNFRSIELLKLKLPKICALVGPNNAGKSNILEAIRRVLGSSWLTVNSFTPEDVFLHDPDRSAEITCYVTPHIQYQKAKAAEAIEIAGLKFEYTRYKIGPQKGQPRLEQTCLNAKGQPTLVMTKAPKKGQPPEFGPLLGIPGDVRDQVPLIYIGTNRSLKEQLPSAKYSLLRQMFESVNEDLQNTTMKVLRNGGEVEIPVKERFGELMDDAMRLLRTPGFIKVELAVKTAVLDQLGFDAIADTDKLDLYFTPLDTMDFYKTLDVLVKQDGFTSSAQDLGDGMQNAIVLGILQAFEQTRKKGAIILIEEPEMFLHPQMQRSLYKTLRKIAEDNQVIYTTHSPHFVTVPDYDEVALVRKAAGKTTVTTSALPKNNTRREKLLKELDPERNELFFARRLLIVEGDTEKLAFPEYAARMGIDLDRVGATVIEVGGKRNLLEFAQIAISFGIPTGIVYDRDSSDFQGKQDDEAAYNASLDRLATANGDVRVWRFDAKYEDHLRSTLGEQVYQEACQRYPHVGKPTKARLIAMEAELPIPPTVQDIIRWLGEKPTPSVQPEPVPSAPIHPPAAM